VLNVALIEYTLDGKQDKVKIAIDRIKSFDPISNGFLPDPYYVAYSGGKDSDALRILFELSGVRYDLVHNHTTVDAPETVRYIRSIPKIKISYPEISMWELIVKKRLPPTRMTRYCCEHLKERGGIGRFVATGIRWAESSKRRTRSNLEIVTKKAKDKIILNADNDEHRRQFEACVKQGKRVLNPIIDWTDADVWEFLRVHDCNSNPLYACGYRRVGCIGCPMASSSRTQAEFARYPKYKAAYIRAFEKMVAGRYADGLPTEWTEGQAVFDWWTTEKQTAAIDDMQLSMF